ncbi:MAG: hypothetical protein DRQ88_09210 [Epsilonproteobacteria bacterium]|nr:MAG: hypothetical protein DRQ88_09210 [Campylobacterota bacterium]
MREMKKNNMLITTILSILAIGFGILTIKSGGFALFGGEAGKQFAGNYVPFVLWFNFCAGFFYIITGIGIFLKKNWSVYFAMTLALSTVLVFVAFGITIFFNNPYEMRTVGAMTFRTIFWIVLSIFSRNIILKK